MKPFDYVLHYPKQSAPNSLICISRGKPVPANDEEYVRQAVLNYLHHELGIHLDDIAVEYAMGKLDKVSKRRADIFVKSRDKVLLLIECKAPHIPLTDEIFHQQALDYAISANHPEILWITNGHEQHYYGYDSSTMQYRPLKSLPDIRKPEKMLFHYLERTHTPWVSPTFEQLWQPTFMAQFSRPGTYQYDTYWFSGNNPHPAMVAAVRIGEWLFFSDLLPSGTMLGSFEVVEDLGVRTKSTPAPNGHRYSQEHRSILIRKAGTSEVLVADFALIVLNQHREVHLAIRLEKKASNSYTIQAGIDRHLHWHKKKQTFSMSHKATKIQMGGHHLTQTKAEAIRAIDATLYDDEGVFQSPMIDVAPSPMPTDRQYLNFFGRWLQYAYAIRLMKRQNKAAKPIGPAKEKKANIMSEAKKMVQAGEVEAGIRYAMTHLHLIGRKNQAIEQIFNWRIKYGIFDGLEEWIKTVLEPKSNLYDEFLTIYFLETANNQQAYKHAQRIPDYKKAALYWESRFYYLLEQQGQVDSPESTAAIAEAVNLDPKYNDYRLLYAQALWYSNEISEALKQFDLVPNLFSNKDNIIDFIVSFLGNFGPYDKLLDYCNRMIKMNPDWHYLFYYARAKCHLFSGQLVDASKDIDEAISFNNAEDDRPQQIQALILWQQGNTAAGYEILKKSADWPLNALYLSSMAADLGNVSGQKTHMEACKQLLNETANTKDVFYHATQIAYTAIHSDAAALKKAMQQAENDLIRTAGLNAYLNFIAKTLKLPSLVV
jgi:hypothetical protein